MPSVRCGFPSFSSLSSPSPLGFWMGTDKKRVFAAQGKLEIAHANAGEAQAGAGLPGMGISRVGAISPALRLGSKFTGLPVRVALALPQRLSPSLSTGLLIPLHYRAFLFPYSCKSPLLASVQLLTRRQKVSLLSVSKGSLKVETMHTQKAKLNKQSSKCTLLNTDFSSHPSRCHDF